MIQLARSPCSLTSMAPRIVRLMRPLCTTHAKLSPQGSESVPAFGGFYAWQSNPYARIMPKESSLENSAEPGIRVTVSLPALIKSASCLPGSGYGPCPSRHTEARDL